MKCSLKSYNFFQFSSLKVVANERYVTTKKDLSVGAWQVESSSLESMAVVRLILLLRMSSGELTNSIPSSIASPPAKVSAEALDFVGRAERCERKAIGWKIDPFWSGPKRTPAKYPSWPYSDGRPASEKIRMEIS